MGTVNSLMPLLVCDLPRIQLPALQCYAAMSFQNGAVSLAMKSGTDQLDHIELLKLTDACIFESII